MNRPMNFMDKYQQMTFYLSLIVMDPDAGAILLKCKEKDNCRVRYNKHTTPVLYYLSPPVVYFESYTEMWFDPKHT